MFGQACVTLWMKSSRGMSICPRHTGKSCLVSAGRPDQAALDAIQSKYTHTMMGGLSNTGPRKPLFQLFPDASPDATDLLERLLQFNPEKRLTAEEALRHPYLAQFHAPDDEPSCGRVIKITMDDNRKVGTPRHIGLCQDCLLCLPQAGVWLNDFSSVEPAPQPLSG